MFKVFSKLGFTMIELLIVIAVLGILAVAVLSAINPIEQINRGRDTGSRSDAEQLLSAVDRFYAAKGYYPWALDSNSINISTNNGTTSYVEMQGANTGAIDVGQDGVNMLDNLSTGGTSELKLSFVTRLINSTQTNALFLYNLGSLPSDTSYVCFKPKSASFREEAWKRCSNGSGALNTLPTDFPQTNACPDDATCGRALSADLATGCNICLP